MLLQTFFLYMCFGTNMHWFLLGLYLGIPIGIASCRKCVFPNLLDDTKQFDKGFALIYTSINTVGELHMRQILANILYCHYF